MYACACKKRIVEGWLDETFALMIVYLKCFLRSGLTQQSLLIVSRINNFMNYVAFKHWDSDYSCKISRKMFIP